MVPPTKLADFKAQLTHANFCGDDDEFTNYDDAFFTARNVLQSIAGQKVVYFISDGLPTASGVNGNAQSIGSGTYDAIHFDNGRVSADALRADPSLILYALYIEVDALLGSAAGTLPEQPRPYLAKITGDPSRVVVVNDAGQLAAQISTLAVPEPPIVSGDKIKAVLTADGFGQRTVKIKSFEEDPSRKNYWRFVTEPVQLFGDLDRAVVNRLEVTAQSSDGKSPKAVAIINFQQKK